jgi:hypothetical protein
LQPPKGLENLRGEAEKGKLTREQVFSAPARELKK